MIQNTQKKKRSWIWTLLFILMNIGILLWTGLSELNRKNSGAADLEDVEIRWIFFVLSFLCFLITVFAESGKYYSLIRQLTNKKDWATSVKVTIYGRYYDNITPSGAGGQPFQILYLKRRGLSDGASLAIPVYAFLLQQLSFVLTAALCFIFLGHLFTVGALKVTAYIGLGCYSLVPILIILSAAFPKGMGKIVMGVLRGLAAIRLIKDPEGKVAKVLQQLQEYSRAINYINRHRSLTLEMFLLSVLYHLGRASLPFFILQAFGGNVDWAVVMVSTFFIYAAITIIPTPGGAGAAEASFYLVFAELPDSGLVFWAMLVWRFFCDYVFLLGGIFLTGWDYMMEKRRVRRQRRQEERDALRQAREEEKEARRLEKDEQEREREAQEKAREEERAARKGKKKGRKGSTEKAPVETEEALPLETEEPVPAEAESGTSDEAPSET